MSENTARRVRDFLEQTGLAAFWRWWSSELRAMAPNWLRDLMHPARAELALEMHADQCKLFSWEEGGWRELARWTRSEDGSQELPPAAASLLRGPSRHALVVMPRGDTLRRTAEVPAALAENLREAIGFDLDRYTPYKPDQVYFDAAVLARDEAQQRLSIEIGVVPRERADRVLQYVAALGLSPVGLLADLPDATSVALDFLPAERSPGAGSASRWTYGLPLTALVVLALATIILPIWQKRATVRSLEPLVNEARGRAEAAETLHRLLLVQQDEHNFLLARRHAQPLAIEVLDEATRILPDDTWVHMFELKSDPKNPGKNHELQVRGETGISGKLISVFEESRLFTQTAYKSPVTKGQPNAGDMFHVGAEVRKHSKPEVGEPGAAALAPPQVPLAPPPLSGSPSGRMAPAPLPAPSPAPSAPPAAASPAPVVTPPGALIPPPPRAAP